MGRPRIGDDEEVTEATLVAWVEQVGDDVAEDDGFAEAMTEKVTIEVESPVAGVLKEILAEEDCTVAVGQSIARVATSEQ